MGSFFSRNKSPATELERIALEIGDLRQKLQKLSDRHANTMYYYCFIILFLSTVVIAHSWLRYDHPRRTYVIGSLTVGSFAILFIGRYIINSFFRWRTRSTTNKLEHAISQKSVLLDLVKETLKFKEAKEILDRYEKEESGSDKNSTRSAPASPNGGVVLKKKDSSDLSRTVLETPKKYSRTPVTTSSNDANQSMIPRPSSGMSNIPITPFHHKHPNAGPARPFLRQTGALDRVLDYFMSDGPSCRNALICSICHTHNGMATTAEYPYISFRCFECGHLNMAKRIGQEIPISKPTIQPGPIKRQEVEIQKPRVIDDAEKSGTTSTDEKKV